MNNLINVVIIGNLHSGKSTIFGHLLHKCGQIDAETIQTFETEGIRLGKGSSKYAWVLDKLKAERERGMTINNSFTKFKAAKNAITLIDTPGHKDFIKNMISGVSNADCAALVISAEQGKVEAGLDSNNGQTLDNLYLLNSLGVKQLLVVVNKMDLTTPDPFSQERFNQIKEIFINPLKKIGFNPEQTNFIPVSGWIGDNLEVKSTSMTWFNGNTLLEAIDALQPPKRSDLELKPLRISFQKIYKIQNIGIVAVGRVESGKVVPGTQVKIAPFNIVSEVKNIESHHEYLSEAMVGHIVGINLPKVLRKDLKRGYLCSDLEEDPALPTESFTAQIFLLNNPGNIKVGYTPVVDCHTAHVACRFEKLISKIDKRTGKEVEANPLFLKKGDCALVELVPKKPMVVESFYDYPSLGRFVFRDSNRIMGYGIIKSLIKIATK